MVVNVKSFSMARNGRWSPGGMRSFVWRTAAVCWLTQIHASELSWMVVKYRNQPKSAPDRGRNSDPVDRCCAWCALNKPNHLPLMRHLVTPSLAWRLEMPHQGKVIGLVQCAPRA